MAPVEPVVRGLLTDVNLQGHRDYLLSRLAKLGLLSLLTEIGVTLDTFRDHGLDPEMADRPLWAYCQDHGLILLTDNRNRDGPESLQATIDELLKPESLPILTIGNKDEFEHNGVYAEAVAEGLAEVLFGLKREGRFYGRGRIYIPLRVT